MTPPHLNNAIDTFLRHLLAEGYSPKTIDTYRRSFTPFLAYLASKGIERPSKVTKEVLLAYQDHIHHDYKPQRKKVLSLGYQANLLKVLKKFFRYLARDGKILSDPAVAVSMPKLPKRLPRDVLTKREVRKLLTAPDTKTPGGYRIRTAFEILYSTGIRSAELSNLTLNDINLTSREIIVRGGKGGKDRIVPLTRKATEVVERYITEHRPKLLKEGRDDTGHLILSDRGGRIDKGWTWRKVKQYARICKIKKNITTHTFRHTFATHLLKNKASIRVIQELLGHESLLSTQVYTKVEITDLKRVIDRSHPRDEMDE